MIDVLRQQTIIYHPTDHLDRETVFTCVYPHMVQTRLPRDQRPTKPVNRLEARIDHRHRPKAIRYHTMFFRDTVNKTKVLSSSAWRDQVIAQVEANIVSPD